MSLTSVEMTWEYGYRYTLLAARPNAIMLSGVIAEYGCSRPLLAARPNVIMLSDMIAEHGNGDTPLVL